MIVATLLAVSLSAVSLPAANVSLAAVCALTCPQGPSGLTEATGTGGGSGPSNAMPSGGTPEPASMLLLVGGALGYGAHRLRRARAERAGETSAK